MHAQAAVDDDLAIPAFLKVDKAEAKRRMRLWEKQPPKPLPSFLENTRAGHDDMSPEFRAQLEADYRREQDWMSAFTRPTTKKAKEILNKLADKKSKVVVEAAPVDRTGMRWCQRRGRWVTDELFFHSGRGHGASPATPGGGDRAKKPAATGRSARETEPTRLVRGSTPRRSTTTPPAALAGTVVGERLAASPVARRTKGADAKAQQRAAVMALLTRPEGATLADIAPLTSPNNFEHTASAYLSSIRKERVVTKTAETSRGNVYRIAMVQ